MTARQSEQSIMARAAAHAKWAQCEDPTAATAAARSAFQKKFLDAADPEGALQAEIDRASTESERMRLTKQLERRVESARKAHFTRLALASARARRNKK